MVPQNIQHARRGRYRPPTLWPTMILIALIGITLWMGYLLMQ